MGVVFSLLTFSLLIREDFWFFLISWRSQHFQHFSRRGVGGGLSMIRQWDGWKLRLLRGWHVTDYLEYCGYRFRARAQGWKGRGASYDETLPPHMRSFCVPVPKSKGKIGHPGHTNPGTGLFREKKRGVENSGEGKHTTIKPLPKNRFGPPKSYDTFSPHVCSRPVIFLGGNGYRPDKSYFLRPPKLVLEGALYSLLSPPPHRTIRFPLPICLSQLLRTLCGFQKVLRRPIRGFLCTGRTEALFL